MPQTDKSRRIHPPSDEDTAQGPSLADSVAEFHDRHPLLTMSAALGTGLLAGALMARLFDESEPAGFGRRLADTAAQLGEGLRERAAEFADAGSEMLAKAGHGAGRAAQVVAEKSSQSAMSLWEGLGGLSNLLFSFGLGRLFK